MGYCIEMSCSTIRIKKDNCGKLLKKLKDFCIKQGSLRWVDIRAIMNSNSIEEAFEELRYEIYENDNGDYEIDYLSGEKLGDEEIIFESISEFIEDGYIEYLGEDGDKWRFVFSNGEMETKCPKIIWE